MDEKEFFMGNFVIQQKVSLFFSSQRECRQIDLNFISMVELKLLSCFDVEL